MSVNNINVTSKLFVSVQENKVSQTSWTDQDDGPQKFLISGRGRRSIFGSLFQIVDLSPRISTCLTIFQHYFSEIERVCEGADFEIDLSTGKSWPNPSLGLVPGSIFPQYLATHVPPIYIRPPDDPEAENNCNLSVVMRINMASYSAGKLK